MLHHECPVLFLLIATGLTVKVGGAVGFQPARSTTEVVAWADAHAITSVVRHQEGGSARTQTTLGLDWR